ncbi:MAG: histidine kinase [Microlunatus sp.]
MTTVAAPRQQAVSGSPGAAWTVGVGCWVLCLAALVLFFSSAGPESFSDDWLFLVTDATMAAVYGTVASVLLARQRHVVIVFLLIAAVGGGLAALGGAWAQAADAGRLPEAPVIEILYSTAWVPGTLSLFLVVPWLVRRDIDRTAWLWAAPGLLLALGFGILGQTLPEDAFALMGLVILVAVVWGLVTAVAVERRRRRAPVGEREGLAWLAVGTAVMALSFLPLLLPYGLVPDWTVPALHLACQTVFPVAILAVVARQRLWGLELSISRTAVAGSLTAVLMAIYLLVSVAVSGLIGNQTVAALGAAAAVVAAVQPSRLWLQRRVRRMVYGTGSDPTTVAAQLGSALGRAESEQALLDSVAETLGHTLRLESVTLRSGGESQPDSLVRARWGNATAEPERHQLVHRGRVVGQVEITLPPGERLDGRGRGALVRLLEVVTAAVVLADNAAALEATRERLTTARLRERQVIRRELHDGLVPWLAGLRLGLQAVQNSLVTDPVAAGTLVAELQTELTRRIDDVRSASRSLLPPVLSELGLHAALLELVGQQRAAGMTVDLVCAQPVATELARLPEGLAETAYGIASEAVTNAARHSGVDHCRLEITLDADGLRLVCSDSGSGIGPDAVGGVGTRAMRERAEEQGGSLSIAAGQPSGTVVTAILPLRPTEGGLR